jgi:hypothetical protein
MSRPSSLHKQQSAHDRQHDDQDGPGHPFEHRELRVERRETVVELRDSLGSPAGLVVGCSRIAESVVNFGA